MNEFQDYKQYLLYMENNYDEEDQITIENFISYYINKYRGFGRYNCEYTFLDDLKNDIIGKLHDFAIIGFNFEKLIYEERNLQKFKNKHFKSKKMCNIKKL
jgi:hypothetical protein